MKASKAAARVLALLWERWDRFAFPERGSASLCIGRILFFAGFIYFFWHRDHLFAGWVRSPDILWRPVGVFRLFPKLNLTPGEIAQVVFAWRLSLVAALLGFATRFSVPAAFILSFWVVGYENNFGQVHNGMILPLLVMGVLCFASCGDAFSVDQLILSARKRAWQRPEKSMAYGWPLQFIRYVIASCYLQAAASKLLHSGLGWVSADNMIRILLTRPTVTPLGIWLAQHETLCFLSAAMILLVQSSAIFALFIPWLALFTVPGLFAFHTLSYLLIGFHGDFFPYLPCFVFWNPFECLVERQALRDRRGP